MTTDCDVEKLERKRMAAHELERRLSALERAEYERAIANAREKACGNELMQDAIFWMDVFTGLGAHPTHVFHGWCLLKSRPATVIPNELP